MLQFVSWHVYNRENREKVQKDEEKERKAVTELEERKSAAVLLQMSKAYLCANLGIRGSAEEAQSQSRNKARFQY